MIESDARTRLAEQQARPSPGAGLDVLILLNGTDREAVGYYDVEHVQSHRNGLAFDRIG